MATLLSTVNKEPIRVELERSGTSWKLLRGGRPYWINGAAGDHSLKDLKAAGGNSSRTWGAEEIAAKLAEAQAEDLTVTAGVWLPHKGDGFDYADPAKVHEQLEKVEAAVRAHRNHPSLLFWALGNEMEVGNDTEALWKAIGEMARLVKRLDPNHPVMTVVAEVSPQKIQHIKSHAPDIDVLGINSYGGLSSLPKRLKEAGWDKPYVVTEFGPLGPWESPRTDWGAAIEATSTEKASFYAKNYDAAVGGQKGWCLGSYAFLWGHKQETTPTWFGLYLPSGEATGALDELILRWTGNWPENRCPRLERVEFEGTRKRLKGGSIVELNIRAVDPDGDRLSYRIEVRKEIDAERPMGAGEKGPEMLSGYPKEFNSGEIKLSIPLAAGAYRVYVYALDGKGRAAMANLPFYSLGA